MVYTIRGCLLAALLLLAAQFSLVQASPAMMTIQEIKPGMHGIAKTVVAGTKIEEFNVEVINVMPGKGGSGDLILVRTSGDLIDRTGGIVQGMSGSPVYIDGKLIGAVAYGWPYADHTIGMVTPISDMLKLWELPNEKYVQQKPKADANKGGNVPAPANEKQEIHQPQLPVLAKPAVTPLMVAGFTPQAMSMLQDKLKPFNLQPYAVGEQPAADGNSQPQTWEPGSAIGVELVRGDASVGAIGTVTYVEGDKILAFGHPFLRKGYASYFLSGASIYTVVNGLESGFKVGAVGDWAGMITQDRTAGLAGQLGRYPSVVPMRINVLDKDSQRTKDDAVQIVQDEQLAPVLAATTLYNTIEKAMDRVGPGTAKVTFEISGKNVPQESVKRENMFYSPASIGEFAVGEFFEAMNLLIANAYTPVDIMDVKVNVEVNEERLTATIVDAKAAVETAKPGDTIAIAIRLKPYRGEIVTETAHFTIPKTQAPGPLLLEVRGGGLVPVLQLITKKQGLEEEVVKVGKKKAKSFDEQVAQFVTRDRNNDVIIEMLDMASMAAELGGADMPLSAKEGAMAAGNGAHATGQESGAGHNTPKQDNPSKCSVTTDYIIENDTQVMLTIVNDSHK